MASSTSRASGAKGEKQRAALLDYWGADEKRVVAVSGDLTQPELGVAAADHAGIAAALDLVERRSPVARLDKAIAANPPRVTPHRRKDGVVHLPHQFRQRHVRKARLAPCCREHAVVALEPRQPLEELHGGAFVVDSLKLALWAVLRSASFEDALCVVVNMGDDADTVGAITGALAGAAYQGVGIPACVGSGRGAGRQVRAAVTGTPDR